jgi:hypothetical protein
MCFASESGELLDNVVGSLGARKKIEERANFRRKSGAALGCGARQAAEVEGENRSGPALNPLKGSSDRSPHRLYLGHAVSQT